MKKTDKRLPDAELEIMKVIWHNQTPISTSEVKQIIDDEGVNDWTQQTIQTLLNRLIVKEFISKENRGKGYIYTPLISESDYISYESKMFLEKLHGNSVTSLMRALFDRNKMSDEDIEAAKEQVKFYKKYGEVFHKGELYRLSSPFDSNEAILEFISEDKNTVILCYANRLSTLNNAVNRVKLTGLDPDAVYVETDGHEGFNTVPNSIIKNREFTGEYLMNYGLKFLNWRDFQTTMRIFNKKQ